MPLDRFASVSIKAMLFIEDLTKPSLPSFRFVDASVGDADVLRELRERGFFVAVIDGSAIHSDATAFQLLGRAFNFPEYFGENWDALEECVRDLEWLPAAGYVCVLYDTEAFFRAAPRTAGMLLDVWAHASLQWSAEAKPFHLVLAWQTTAV